VSKKSISSRTAGRLSRILPPVLVVAILAAIVLGYFFNPAVQSFIDEAWVVLTSEDRERIEAWVDQFDWWGPLLLMALFLVQMFAFVLPSWLLIVVSVLAYGPWWGSVIALAGILLAASVAYGLGVLLSEVTLRKMLGESSERKMRVYLERYGFWLVVIVRLAPFLSNDVISFVAGLTSMGFRKFTAATALGISPLIALIAFLGTTNERLRTGFIVVSILSMIGFAVYVWWDHKHRPVE
jgi:uncharacterized membrane protein YdjX (TVP38/TMEM64 family)